MSTPSLSPHIVQETDFDAASAASSARASRQGSSSGLAEHANNGQHCAALLSLSPVLTSVDLSLNPLEVCGDDVGDGDGSGVLADAGYFQVDPADPSVDLAPTTQPHPAAIGFGRTPSLNMVASVSRHTLGDLPTNTTCPPQDAPASTASLSLTSSSSSCHGTDGPAGRMRRRRESIQQIQIPNFRDLHDACLLIKPGRVFRSATPAHATEDDALALVNDLGVKTIVDLRDRQESAEDKSCDQLYKHFVPKTDKQCRRESMARSKIMRRSASLAKQRSASASSATTSPASTRRTSVSVSSLTSRRSSKSQTRSSCDGADMVLVNHLGRPSSIDGNNDDDDDHSDEYTPVLVDDGDDPFAPHPNDNTRKVVETPIAPKSIYKKTIMGRATARQKAKLAKFFFMGLVSSKGKKKCLETGCKIINEIGLLGLNKMILQNSGAALSRVLRLASHRANHPVLVHCSHGKDRTGLCVALLLSVAGATREQIVQDYAESERSGGSGACAHDLKQKPGLDPDEWASAKPELMIKTLDFIDQRWGSVSNYLCSAGFSLREQARLKTAITSDSPPPSLLNEASTIATTHAPPIAAATTRQQHILTEDFL